ncbi:VanW family protein [Sphaerisporangium corydalis]|uniref:VanW family protein n=1 Tax=Sphaerisporangium corydalis TaxID=1441875 RepID=A0ABV9EHA9_9ACTN|nr:VanW family protein [Sphaerisporangium corydalis]
MRNAGASIDPPPDPFAAVRPDSPVSLPADRRYSKDQAPERGPARRKKLPPGVSPLPPGVSADIFATTPPPGSTGLPPQPVTLPPPAPPPEPWPMTASVRVRRADDPPPEPTVVIAPEPPEDRPRLRLLLLLTGGLALVFLLAYAIPAMYMWGKILPGTRVGDVRIGSLSETEAIDRVHQRFDGNDQQSVALMLDGRRVGVLDPRDAGLAIDVEGTVADAQTGFPGPFAVWQALTGERELPLRVSLNAAKLTQRIRKVATLVDRTAHEGAIVYRGTKPRVVPPEDGLVLDRQATADAIKRAFVDAPAAVPLPVTPVRPRAGKALFDAALDTARRAVSAPITLTNGGRRVRLSPKDIAANLRFAADERGVVRPQFDAWRAVDGLETRLVGVAEAPREAGFVIVNGAPKLVHARTGKGVNAIELAGAVSKVINAGGSRTIPVSLAITQPVLDDEDAMRLAIKEKVGEFTTYFPCCAPRVVNIRRAAELLNGLVVKPSGVFSLNDSVGEPTTARGFVSAQAIEDDRLVLAPGGGLSQVATTMYNAALLAGLEDVGHTAHRFHVVRYPPGRDAAVSYPEEDMRWKNDTEYGVLVQTTVTDTSLTVVLWSTRKYDQVDVETSGRTDLTQPETRSANEPGCLPMEGGPGFTVTVTRVFYRDGKVLKRDHPLTTVYEPQPKVICVQGTSATQGDPVGRGRSGTKTSVDPLAPDLAPDAGVTPDPTAPNGR